MKKQKCTLCDDGQEISSETDRVSFTHSHSADGEYFPKFFGYLPFSPLLRTLLGLLVRSFVNNFVFTSKIFFLDSIGAQGTDR